MKLLMENWRRFVNETPLDDYDSFISSNPRKYQTPSVGHRREEDPKFIEKVEDLMAKTPDNWVIVTIDDTVYSEEVIASEEFKEWLASKKYSPDSKVLVVGSSPLDNDYNDPEWILHDILGHGCGQAFLDNEKTDSHTFGFSDPKKWISEMRGARFTISVIHNFLKEENAPVSKAKDMFDKTYDVFASIILGDISYKEAIGLFDKPPYSNDEEASEAVQLVKRMFAFADDWVDKIPPISTRETLLTLW